MSVKAINWDAEVARLTAVLRVASYVKAHAGSPIVDVYARISRKPMKSDEEKTVRQVYRCLTRLIELGYRLGDIFVDENRSAWLEDGIRPAFDEVLARRLSGASDGVVIRYESRLARQPFDLEALITRTPKRRPYTVVTLARVFHLEVTKDANDLRAKIMAAQESSEEKSVLACAKQQDRLTEGSGKNGAAPFGHAWGREIPAGQLKAERDAIAWGILHALAGGSYGEIAREWTERGLTTRTGFHWHSGNVRRCLANPRHGGWLAYKDEVHSRLADESAAIVDEDTWHRWSLVLKSRTRGRRPAVESPNIAGSGVSICYHCGTPLTGASSPGHYRDGEKRRGYRCPPRGCGRVAIDARRLETWVGDRVVAVLCDPRHRAMLARRDDDLAVLRASIEDVESAADGVRATMKLAHAKRRGRYQSDLAELEEKLSALYDKEAALETQASTLDAAPTDIAEIEALWLAKSTPASVRRTMIRQAFPDGFYVKATGRGFPQDADQRVTLWRDPTDPWEDKRPAGRRRRA